MERLNDEIGWNQLRYDIRTYTAQMSETEEAERPERSLMDINI